MNISNLSNYEGRLSHILCAVGESLHSQLEQRHGCVVVSGGKIINSACNTIRSSWAGRNRCSTHAEMSVLFPLLGKQCFL